jgi:hypothetical protein
MILGGIVALIVLLLIGRWIRPWYVKKYHSLNKVYSWGLAFRIIGTTTYLLYALYFSGGSVDAFIYDNYASTFAGYFSRWDFSPFTDEKLWRNGQFFHTNFVSYPAAFFMLATFNSTFGIYLLFSLVCFAGLVLLFKSFVVNYEGLDLRKMALLLFLFPALWFWTSTIGKDAFMFLGIGLICFGISNRSLNYFYIAIGLFILYAFRPPTAYMALIALATFFILNSTDPVVTKLFKIVVGVVLLLFILNYISELWGVEDFSNESITELQSDVLRNNNYGTGALEQKSGGLASIPRGVIDVVARPFLWESSNLLSLATALEINFMLLILFLNRRSVLTFIRNSLKNRLSTFALSFIVIYVLSVGIFENNIGLIARHRTIMFPFLFLMAYSYAHVPKGRTNIKPTVVSPATYG